MVCYEQVIIEFKFIDLHVVELSDSRQVSQRLLAFVGECSIYWVFVLSGQLDLGLNHSFMHLDIVDELCYVLRSFTCDVGISPVSAFSDLQPYLIVLRVVLTSK